MAKLSSRGKKLPQLTLNLPARGTGDHNDLPDAGSNTIVSFTSANIRKIRRNAEARVLASGIFGISKRNS